MAKARRKKQPGKTLVTGAAGFIGHHVTRMLLEQGRPVRALIYPGEDTSNLDGMDVERVVGDVQDLEAVRRAVHGCERVFHLAAIYAIWLEEPRRMYDVNVGGSRNVCRAALEAGVERMVYTSSIAALGVNEGGEPADEETPFNQWDANEYVLSKYISELECREYIRQGLPAVIVNPAFPFGWGDVGPTPTGGIILAILNKRFPGWFDSGLNIVDVEDVARGHLLAEAKGTIGERYLLSGENFTGRQFMRVVGDVCGVPVPDRRIPLSVLTTMGRVLEKVSDRVTHTAPLLTRKTVLYSAQKLYYDNSKARRELGYRPTPVRQSIGRAAEWFRHRGLAPA